MRTFILSTTQVTINLVVYNGEKYIRQCLDSVLTQSYPHELIEVNILDNASTDLTLEKIRLWTKDHGLGQENAHERLSSIVHKPLANFSLVESEENLGMWPGQEELLKQSSRKYVVVLSVDIILHPDFIKNAVEILERDEKIGALQARIYKYELVQGQLEKTNIIDTLGFEIYKSRRIVNIGHGNAYTESYGSSSEIFAVEGAVPVFRKQALEDCRLASQHNKIVDHDYFWYGDDLDLPWRMRIFGWKQIYAPTVIAYHDRKTTKGLAGSWKEFIKIRKTVPMFKRRLDWRNTTFTIIKNDFAANLWHDLPYIFWRQLRLWIYFLLFEPAMFLELFKVAKMLPRMLKRRKEIMRKACITAKDFRQWIR